jgi:long-chain acyl-CoA synthetase
VPKEVYFTSELPKTNVGKILRRKIKEAHVEQYGAGTSES